MDKVAVLMSTYNGEKYIREQIDSILNQQNVEFELFIWDDGSSDSTVNFIEEYLERYSNIHFNCGENLGVGNAFMNLLYSVPDTFDYYALSDQDDIWYENKLAEAIGKLKETDALLYASNQECVDRYGNSLGLRYSEDCYIHLSPVEILEKNMVAGCTMVMSNRFYKIVTLQSNRPSPDLLRNRIHDVWLAMIASLHNGIIYDKRAFIKYRQHENNVVGAYEVGWKKKTKERIRKLQNNELRNGRSKLAIEVCEKFPAQVSEFPLVKLCADAKSFGGKMAILKNGKRLRAYTNEGKFVFFAKVMMGLF